MNYPRPLAVPALVWSLLFTLPAGAQPAAAPAPAPAAAVPAALPEPLSATAPDNTRYLNNPKLLPPCTERVAAIQGQPCDMIFIGDSITAGWLGKGREVWHQFYGSRHALDFGIGGDKTQNVLWRLEHMDVKRLRPKLAVILIGTNNTRNSAPDIADGVKAVIAETQADFPGVKIILVSIMPNRRANALMMSVNTLIRPLADDRTVYYLDLVPVMKPVGDNWAGLGTDHLHPEAAGYQLWAEAMEPLVKKLLSS